MTSYLGVGYEIKGIKKANGRKTTIKKRFMDVCFAGMWLDYYELESVTPTHITFYPYPNREVIKTPQQIIYFLDIVNRLFPAAGNNLTLERYLKGITVSADLPYAYILAYFSTIRMLDENPFAAASIAKLGSLGFARDPHLAFIVGSCLQDFGLITVDHRRGHYFPEWEYWGKDVLIKFRDFEKALLSEPPYKERPSKGITMEVAMFGREEGWGYKEFYNFVSSLPEAETRFNFMEVKKWLS